MGVYFSSDGTEKETSTLNTFNLVNGLIKNVYESQASNGMDAVSAKNIEVLKAELLERLDTRPAEQKKNVKITVPLSESDLDEIGSGCEFNWTFTSDIGTSVDVLVRGETEEDVEG